MTTSTLSQAMTRIAALQKQAVTSCDAVAFFPYQQEALPYFVNRLGPMDVLVTDEEGASESFVYDEYTILMRLVEGHLTEGYEGDVALQVYEHVPAVLDIFAAHPFLDSTAYPTELDYIAPKGVEIAGHTGLTAFQNSGTEAIQVGVEFTLMLRIMRNIDIE